MSKNYYGGSKHTGLKVFAWIVTILLIAAIVAGVWYVAKTTNNFTENPFSEEDVEYDGDSFVPTPDDENDDGDDPSPMSISTYKIGPEDYEEYGIDPYSVQSAYTLTVSFDSTATLYSFEWSCDDTSGCVSISPSADNLSCTVTCSGAFGTQVTVTCTDLVSGLFATCVFDYVCRPNSNSMIFSVDNGSKNIYTSGKTYSLNSSTLLLSGGSTEVMVLPAIEDTSASKSDYEDSVLSFYSSSYSVGSVVESYSVVSCDVYTLNAGLDLTLYSYDKNGSLDLSVPFMTSFVCSYTTTGAGSQSWYNPSWDRLLGYMSYTGSSGTSDPYSLVFSAFSYQSLQSAYSQYYICLNFTVEGSITGEVYDLYYPFLTDLSNIGTSTTSVSLDNSSLYF